MLFLGSLSKLHKAFKVIDKFFCRLAPEKICDSDHEKTKAICLFFFIRM